MGGGPCPTLCAQCQGEVISLMVVFSRERGQLLLSSSVWLIMLLAPARGVLLCVFMEVIRSF